MEGLLTFRMLYCAVLLLLYCSAANACKGTLLVTGITDEEKAVILQEHNRLRQLVANGRYPGQPGAENMREMVWDDELAAKAQQWAENCQFRHDPHRTINRFTMGQNLAIIWSTAPLEADDGDFPSRIKNWFNEVQKYSFGDAWSPKTGHYSQLVWGETSLIGCGFAEYKDTNKYNKLYVCNYGPGGNIIGYNPYEAGKPACDSYGMRPSSRYQGLCSAPNSISNSISRNTIQTYEYTHTNSYNTNIQQHTTDTKTYTQPAQQQQISTHPSSFPYSSKQATTYTHTLTKAFNKFDSGNQKTPNIRSYTTEASHQNSNNNNKYKKNKYESYKPSKTEFQTAVRKHTILRTYINTSSNSRSTSSNTSESNFQPKEVIFESASEAPIKKGWSLLTWRG